MKICRSPCSMKPSRSARYVRLSTIRGVSTHLAPSGRAGMRIDHVSRFGTSIVNAIDLPSGVQTRLDGLSSRRATRVPAGDQTAFEPFVRNRFFDPSAFIIQSDELRRSLILSTQPRV